jgi:sialic acid synthase SpsE
VPCVLIAECCQNHNGSLETLKAMIHAAAESGADFVKIQGLRSSELTFRSRFERGLIDSDGTVRVITRPFAPEFARLSRLDLTDDDERWFVEECRRAGVKSMITAFTLGSVSRFATAGFDALKIASYDCKSTPLLEQASVFSEVFVSTGASYEHEISAAAATLSGNQLSLLHCVTIYPTPLDQLHLRRMEWLRSLCPNVGFSDHTSVEQTGLRASKLAIMLGADVVERHFTVLPRDQTRDGPVSIDPSQLVELRRFSQLDRQQQEAEINSEWPEWQLGLGQLQRELSHGELLNRDYYSGRVASFRNGVQVGSDGITIPERRPD